MIVYMFLGGLVVLLLCIRAERRRELERKRWLEKCTFDEFREMQATARESGEDRRSLYAADSFLDKFKS